jgi:flavin-dependent dehydrogenase
MPGDSFDTIIVGARCAGASLAIHLAKAGQKVLLLDSSKLPSDQPMSTHVVGAIGAEWLDELGVGAEVRKMAPPSHGLRIDMLGARLDVNYQRGRAGHCLRRMHLDRLLQEAAVRAGAELRDQTKVVGLVRAGGRVVGVETAHGGARSEARREQRARVVVGADGRNSDVAEMAGAKEYQGYDSPRFWYWAYWPAKPAWDAELLRLGSYIAFVDARRQYLVFQTDSNLLVVGVGLPVAELPSWRGRFEEAYLEHLRAWPLTAAIVEGSAREGHLIGALKLRYFFREAAGPGFALVGDAGLFKDPTPGFGITDAVRDARSLGRAILAGNDEALVRYWRERDMASTDLFYFAAYMGDPAYVNTLNQRVYRLASRSPDLLARVSAQADRELSPFEAIPIGTVLRAVAGGLVTGDFSVVRTFFAAGKRGAEMDKVRKARASDLAALGTVAPAAE